MPYVNSAVCHAQKSKTTHSRKTRSDSRLLKGLLSARSGQQLYIRRYTGDHTNTCRRIKTAVKSGAHDIGFRTY